MEPRPARPGDAFYPTATAKSEPADAIAGSVGMVALRQFTSGDELGALETITVIPNNPDSDDRDRFLRDMLKHVISRPVRVASEAQRFKKKKGEADAAPNRPLDPELVKNKMQLAEKIVMQMQSSSSKIKAWMDLADTSSGDERKQYFDKAIREARGVRIEANSKSAGSDRGGIGGWLTWEGIGGRLVLLWPMGLAVFGAILTPLLKAITDSFGEAFGKAIAQGVGSEDIGDYLGKRFRKSTSETAIPAEAKVSGESLPPTPS
jgi:hypothetical protein